ncbi:hypothetical protein EDB92DRAFT_1943153 [Lactarius akahatsu]|uniref:BRCT domain-containing protein n=1 Tax=Lactarius akahatsu TaxID=416441 RepID=A0AAD4LQQ5_9AGAM|nr:hypothetical protein EDB92DRAFT_1943153 [Lactarius akahatsu]
MTRRVNRSKKVPGVKLRPARPEEGRTLAEQRTPPPSSRLSDAPEDFEISFIDTCPRPFRGFTICTTGVDRSTIFPKAGEMGANTTAAFTDYVTHLIAEEHGGAKYWVERKIPIVRPSWIQDTFEIWQRGDDFDFAAKVEEHRLPTFSGITLCVSGIEDLDRRTTINRTITEHRGKYAKTIERPVRVTHLLCSGDDETDKMRYARKFNERGEADIKLVWEEWFWDSLDFGGRFEETAYLITRPRPERRRLPPLHHLSCKEPEPPEEQPQVEADAPDEEEMAVARRVPGATLRVWESLLAPRGYTKVGSELVKAGPAEAPKSTPEPSLPPSGAKRDKGKGRALNPPSPPRTRKGRSALGTFSRSKSFAPCTASIMEDHSTSTPRQPFRKAHSLFLPQLEPTAHVAREPDGSKLPIFAGLRFRVRAEARSVSVRSAIESCGGTWVENEDEEERIDFVIVRLVSGSKLYVDEADATLKPRYRTECWLEGCLSRERICSVDEHPSFSPLSHTIHLPSVVLSPSGLDLAEDTWVKRLSRALGITHAPAFSRSTTHLLCPGATGAKYTRARTWNTPVVDMYWLSHIARTGTLPLPEMFLVPDSRLPDADMRHTTIPAKVPDLAQAEQTTTLPQRTPPVHTLPLQTTQPEIGPANQELSFGQPSLLADRDEVVPSSSPTLPPLSSPSGSSRPRSFSLSAHTSNPSNHSTGPVPAAGSDTEDDDEAAPRVPSSNTPSPLKMPSDQSDPAARALHESISNLLGKRSVGAMSMGEHGEPPPRRKRARPRSKPDAGGAETGIGIAIDAGVSNIHLPPVSMYTTSFAFGDEPENGNPNSNAALDDSMSSGLQAVYEDPSQAAERRKLISLLNGAPGQSRMREERIHRAAAAAHSNVASNSGRMAGF